MARPQPSGYPSQPRGSPPMQRPDGPMGPPPGVARGPAGPPPGSRPMGPYPRGPPGGPPGARPSGQPSPRPASNNNAPPPAGYPTQPAPPATYMPLSGGYAPPAQPGYGPPPPPVYRGPPSTNYAPPQPAGYAPPPSPGYSAPEPSGYGAPPPPGYPPSGYANPPPPAQSNGNADGLAMPPSATSALQFRPPPSFPSQRRVYPTAAYPGGMPAGPANPPPPVSPTQPPSQQTTSSNRIDPSQIPRPNAPPPQMIFETRVGGQANLPPPATSSYVVRDTGNCSPRMMRSTLNQIPCSNDLLLTCGMSLALCVQPLAVGEEGEEAIQVVNFEETGPVRCTRCKGYINPGCKFVDQGKKFVCNLCGFTNETPLDYFCHLSPDGLRRDVLERPELCRGSVEFVAPAEYMIRTPMPPVFFFVIDVSLNACAVGGVEAACKAVQKVLQDLPGGDRTLVGLATFNSTLHFYSLNPQLQQPTMLVVPDVVDVYTPLASDLLVPLHQGRGRLESLLDAIPSMFAASKVADSALPAALKAASLAMAATGGKILAFQSTLASTGLGSLQSREEAGRNANPAGDKDRLKLLQPLDKTLKGMAVQLANLQVSVDIFLTTQSYADVASLAIIPQTTGGQVYYYYPFNAAVDSAVVYNDLRWNVMRAAGMEAVMKVRCSTGLSVADYSGAFHRLVPAELYLPSIDCDKSIVVHLKHDEKLPDNSEACFQCALLYTTQEGERRVRVHTLCLPTSTQLSSMYRGADLDTHVAVVLKKAAVNVINLPLNTVREAIVAETVATLYAYRKHCAAASAMGQLILPEALKLLPLYTLALVKSVGLRTNTRLDERSYWLHRCCTISVARAIPLLYPRLFSLRPLFGPLEVGEVAIPLGGLPETLLLSSEKISLVGMFLIENGEQACLYVGEGADREVVTELLGNTQVTSGLVDVRELPNDYSKKLNALLNTIRRQRCCYLSAEAEFFQWLVEDRSLGGMSYVEFLIHVHRTIQAKMAP